MYVGSCPRLFSFREYPQRNLPLIVLGEATTESDSVYHFLVDSEPPNGIPFDFKSIEKYYLQSYSVRFLCVNRCPEICPLFHLYMGLTIIVNN